MKTSNARTTILQTWAGNPVAATAAALLGAAAAVTVAYFAFGILAAGDEPPIRVRNGSIELEVVHSGRHWQQVGVERKWKVSGGTRGSDEYQLYLAPTDPARCGNIVSARGGVVRFVLDGNETTWVDFRSTGQKTEVTAGMPLTRSSDKKTLSYGATGNFISSIRVDGDPRCAFDQKDDGLHTLVTE